MNLVEEARQVVADLGLLPVLQPYGEARLVGGVALDMIVKRDIDIHAVIDSGDILAAAETLNRHLYKKTIVKKVSLIFDRPRQGVRICIPEIGGLTGSWLVEIWITRWAEYTDFELVEQLQRSLTRKQREDILRIKQEFFFQGILKDDLRTLIYRAVLEGGVGSSQEFLKWKKGLHSDWQGQSDRSIMA